MAQDSNHRLHAGDPLQDLCRVCKTVRGHTVIVTDGAGNALRVICDYCGSQHNYRGGVERQPSARPVQIEGEPAGPSAVSDRERSMQPVNVTAQNGTNIDLEILLRRIIREETGLTPVPIAEKWRGGDMVLRPANRELQEKIWPIETFFHKVVMLRNRLRVLEQQINGAELPEDLKVRLQGYITGCYGTLTSFNVLFAEDDDRFRGQTGDGTS